MENMMEQLTQCALFEALSPDQLRAILRCSGSAPVTYRAGETLLDADEPVQKIGVVLSGCIHCISEDYWGNRALWSTVAPGALVGTVFALSPGECLPYRVLAQENSTVLFLNVSCITSVCSRTCESHLQLLCNLLKIVSTEQVAALRKLEHMSRRSTREKLLSYLSEQAKTHHSPVFDIPFDRQELADYLTVERSAMSAELGRMQREGLLTCSKSHFHLLST